MPTLLFNLDPPPANTQPRRTRTFLKHAPLISTRLVRKPNLKKSTAPALKPSVLPSVSGQKLDKKKPARITTFHLLRGLPVDVVPASELVRSATPIDDNASVTESAASSEQAVKRRVRFAPAAQEPAKADEVAEETPDAISFFGLDDDGAVPPPRRSEVFPAKLEHSRGQKKASEEAAEGADVLVIEQVEEEHEPSVTALVGQNLLDKSIESEVKPQVHFNPAKCEFTVRPVEPPSTTTSSRDERIAELLSSLGTDDDATEAAAGFVLSDMAAKAEAEDQAAMVEDMAAVLAEVKRELSSSSPTSVVDSMTLEEIEQEGEVPEEGRLKKIDDDDDDDDLPSASEWLPCPPSAALELRQRNKTPLPRLVGATCGPPAALSPLIVPSDLPEDESDTKENEVIALHQLGSSLIEMPDLNSLSIAWRKGAAAYHRIRLQSRCRRIGLLRKLSESQMVEAIPESPCASRFSSFTSSGKGSTTRLSSSLKSVSEEKGQQGGGEEEVGEGSTKLSLSGGSGGQAVKLIRERVKIFRASSTLPRTP